jgi:hypothetical protein
MRTVAIVPQLCVPPGVYVRKSVDAAEASFAWNLRSKVVHDLIREYGHNPYAVAALMGLAAAGTPWPVLLAGHYLWKRHFATPEPLVVLADARLPERSNPLIASRAAVFPRGALAGSYLDYNEEIFHGMFKSSDDLKAVMEAFGGNGELHIVDQVTANEAFVHAGGGRFSTGLHVPHPKDPLTLVPIVDYQKAMQDEARAELYEIFAALGAKRIIVADTDTAKLKGKVKVLNPGGTVKGQMEARYGFEHVTEHTYYEGTFDPDLALRKRRWLGDDKAVKAVVENRVHGAQATFREFVTVNLAVEGAVDVIALAAPSRTEVKGAASFVQTWEYFVEFFPKR